MYSSCPKCKARIDKVMAEIRDLNHPFLIFAETNYGFITGNLIDPKNCANHLSRRYLGNEFRNWKKQLRQGFPLDEWQEEQFIFQWQTCPHCRILMMEVAFAYGLQEELAVILVFA